MPPGIEANGGRSRRFASAVIGSLMIIQGGACAPASSPRPLPSIVIVTIDTLRADHLGVYGYFRDTSPAIDRFALEAVVFENAITPMATTLPAHVSLMTSTHTITHGIKGNFAQLGTQFGGERGIRTLAEILDQAGYATAAFVSALPLRDHTGIQTGFNHFDEPDGRARLAEETIRRAIQWLPSRESSPAFLWIHLWDPHAPYDPPPGFAGVFEMEDGLAEFLEVRGTGPDNARSVLWNNGYDGEILYVDQEIGRLLAALKEQGMYDESTIVLAGDHGEGLGQHGWRDHGRIYNEQLFVPLIIKFPNGFDKAGQRVNTMASLLDVVPTLVDQLELPIDDSAREQFEGLDLLGDAVAERAYVFAERTHRERSWEGGRKYALLSRDWKFFYATESENELYRMTDDRNELRNVMQANPQRAEQMLEVVETLLAAEVEYQLGEIPADRIEQLKALGYIK